MNQKERLENVEAGEGSGALTSSAKSAEATVKSSAMEALLVRMSAFIEEERTKKIKVPVKVKGGRTLVPTSRAARDTLYEAVAQKSLGQVQELVEMGIPLITEPDLMPLTVLCVRNNWEEGLEYLLNKGAPRGWGQLSTNTYLRQHDTLFSVALDTKSPRMIEFTWGIMNDSEQQKAVWKGTQSAGTVLLYDFLMKKQKEHMFTALKPEVRPYRNLGTLIYDALSAISSGVEKGAQGDVGVELSAERAKGVLKNILPKFTLEEQVQFMQRVLVDRNPKVLEVLAKSNLLPESDGSIVGLRSQILQAMRAHVFPVHVVKSLGEDKVVRVHLMELMCLASVGNRPNYILDLMLENPEAREVFWNSSIAKHGIVVQYSSEHTEVLHSLKKKGDPLEKLLDLEGNNPLHMELKRHQPTKTRAQEILKLCPLWATQRNIKGELPIDLYQQGNTRKKEDFLRMIEEYVIKKEVGPIRGKKSAARSI